jgi:hypothetical protein
MQITPTTSCVQRVADVATTSDFTAVAEAAIVSALMQISEDNLLFCSK